MREASGDEVKGLRKEAGELKEVVAEQTLELRLLKKACSGMGRISNEISCIGKARDHPSCGALPPPVTLPTSSIETCMRYLLAKVKASATIQAKTSSMISNRPLMGREIPQRNRMSEVMIKAAANSTPPARYPVNLAGISGACPTAKGALADAVRAGFSLIPGTIGAKIVCVCLQNFGTTFGFFNPLCDHFIRSYLPGGQLGFGWGDDFVIIKFRNNTAHP